MKIITIKNIKWLKPQIKWFPAVYRDGKLIFFPDLRITIPFKTIHVIFKKKKKTK